MSASHAYAHEAHQADGVLNVTGFTQSFIGQFDNVLGLRNNAGIVVAIEVAVARVDAHVSAIVLVLQEVVADCGKDIACGFAQEFRQSLVGLEGALFLVSGIELSLCFLGKCEVTCSS